MRFSRKYILPIGISPRMKKVSIGEVVASSPEGTKDVVFRQLIAKDLDAPNFYMRLFDVGPGGYTPRHRHSWEHEVFVVSGSGKVVIDDREERVIEGDAVFIEPNDLHQFVNDSDSLMRMICVIPRPSGD